jgi:hypothetical protein
MKKLFLVLAMLALLITIPNLIFAQLVNDFRVNDDSTTTSQYNSRVGVDANGNFAAVWMDGRVSTGDIYCQLYYANGQRRGNNFLVSSYSGHSNNTDIAMRKDGSFAVCWIDTVPKFRLFNSNGIPISIESSIEYAINNGGNPLRISCDTSGNFVLVYQKFYSFNNKDIHFQRFDNLGNKIGISTRVNNDTLTIGQHLNPDVTMRKDGSFIVTWQDQRPPAVQDGDDIYMQMYDKYGNKIGSNVRVNNDIVTLDYQFKPFITSDDSGNFCIAYTEIPDYLGEAFVLFQLYNANGTAIGNNINISNSSYSEVLKAISKRSNGDFIICYARDAGARYVPYIQRVNSNGTLKESAFLVTSQYPYNEKFVSDIMLNGDRINTTWSDNRFGNPDVFCNIRSYTIPDSITSITHVATETPSKYSLSQNYPNPFNSMCNVQFSMYNAGNAKLVVYDVMGREVQTLVNESLKSGTYEVSFDGSRLNSGVYFYKLITNGFTETRKMLMIK